MATSTAQRTGIWIIAIVMTIGTLAGFIAMILAPENEKADSSRLQKLYAEYQQKVQAQNDELSKKYYAKIAEYKAMPASFDSTSVTELTTKDLVVGDGEEIKKDTQYSAYYIGWNPKGKVFDQSIDGDKLKAPIAGDNLIEGWNEGVIGMKIGGIRELTIPSAKAYKDQDKGADIPPNTPLKFILMVIPTPKEVEVPKELMQSYGG